MEKVAIAGAGLAGFTVARKLRELGYKGSVSLFGNEGMLPYDRPALSKGHLKNGSVRDDLFLQPLAFYEQHQIAVAVDREVQSIEPGCRKLVFEGSTCTYDKLVLATGAVVNELPIEITRGLGGVYSLRDVRDSEEIARALEIGKRVLIVGGGYLGLELAAAAVEAGCSVSLIEAAPRILQRVAAQPTSDCFRALHRSHGVDIIEGAGLVSLHGNHTVRSAQLSNGRDIQTDCVFIGIGISPNTSLAERAGLKIENGICVDKFCRTSDPNIWAAGDCAAFPCGEKFHRLESVGNATAMGECVAGNLLGLNRPYTAKPWFWSDQYDQRLQIAGVSAGHDRVVVRAGKKHASVSHWYYNGARLIAADVINDPKTYVIAKRLIENGLSPAPGLIADPDYNIKLALKG